MCVSDPDADEDTGGNVLLWVPVPDADEDTGGNALGWVPVTVADVVAGMNVSDWCNKLGLNAVVDKGVSNSSDERKDKLQLVKSFKKFGDSEVTRTNSE